MRPIDADALLEAMNTDVMGGLNYRHFIEEAPAIGSMTWIPCSERLPSEKEWTDSYIHNKKASEFFVMIKGADRPTTLYLSRDHYWFDENRDFYEVVAWMLMPDPWKGADDENA